MALSKELEAELKKLQLAIEKFMQIHNNPYDTSIHNEVAKELKEFTEILSRTEHSTTETSSANPTESTTNPTEDTPSPQISGRRSISASVGKGGTNKEEDVVTIQELLNQKGYNLEADGKIGNKTIRAIKMFQGRVGIARPDGLVSPDKNTMKGLLGEIPAGPPSTGISAIIQGGESGAAGYNAYNRGTQGNSILGPNGPRSLVSMTLAQIMADQKRPKSDPQTLFAVGKYQMIPTTLKEGVAALNLDHATKFDSTTQEYLFSDYLLGRKRPAIRAYIQGTGTAQAAQIAGAQEWASIADPRTNKSYYDGSGGNSAHITAEDFLATLDEAKVEYKKNIAAGMDPDAAYRKAVAGVQGEDSSSETDTNTDTVSTDTNDDTSDTTSDTTNDDTPVTTSQATIKKTVGRKGANEAEDVSLVQELLNAQGEKLKVDGTIGLKTIRAIKRFQKTLGIAPPNGLIEPGGNVIAALTGNTGTSTDSNDNPDTTGDTSDTSDNSDTTSDTTDTGETSDTTNDDTSVTTSQATIKKSVGRGGENEAEDVSLVQELLNAQGERLKVDGTIGLKTIKAIKRFQQTLNIGSPDGLIEPGKATIAALTGSSSGDTNTTEEDTSSQATINKSVGRGGVNEAEDVSLVQELLNAQGERLKVDGTIGLKTIKAIKRFQRTLNIVPPDGLIEPGKATIAALTGSGTDDSTDTDDTEDLINTGIDSGVDAVVEDTIVEEDDDSPTGTPSDPSTKIQQSVGRKGVNNPEDVRIIQEMLLKNNENVGVDGKIGGETIGAIISIQNRMGMNSPDGLIEPDKNTFKALLAGNVPPPFKPSGKYFSHPDAHNVRLVYGDNAVPLNNEAEHLLRSILAASGNRTGTVTSSLRTYYHQARVMIQYYTIAQMEGLYAGGAELARGRRASGENIQKFADFLEQRDKARGAVISKHIPGHAIDVVPRQNRAAYAAKARELVAQSGSGVTHFIELGQYGEKVDHIEFKMKVT